MTVLAELHYFDHWQ